MFLPHITVDATGHSVLSEVDLKMTGPGGAAASSRMPRSLPYPRLSTSLPLMMSSER